VTKILEKNLKGGISYFGSWFHDGKGVAEQSSSCHDCQEEKGVSKQGSGQDTAPKNTLPETYALQVSPHSTFYHLPIISSYYESFKGLTHSPGQSPRDLVISGSTVIDVDLHSVFHSTYLLIYFSGTRL
jgi:hypothetical protein